MPVHDDGNLVKAYGFVAIYFARLEAEIDERLDQSEELLRNMEEKPLDRVLRWRFSDRVEALRNVFTWAETNGPDFNYKDEQLRQAVQTLDACLQAANERNETLHSPIVSDLTSGDVIRHTREGDYPVTSVEVYNLANAIHDLGGNVFGLNFTLNSILGLPRLSR